jgi:hypothetical protein
MLSSVRYDLRGMSMMTVNCNWRLELSEVIEGSLQPDVLGEDTCCCGMGKSTLGNHRLAPAGTQGAAAGVIQDCAVPRPT